MMMSHTTPPKILFSYIVHYCCQCILAGNEHEFACRISKNLGLQHQRDLTILVQIFTSVACTAVKAALSEKFLSLSHLSSAQFT